MKPLLPDEPIGARTPSGGDTFVVAALCYPRKCQPHYLIDQMPYKVSRKELVYESTTLLTFIAKAEAYFKPLVELPFTEKVLESMMGAYYGIDPKRVPSGNIYSMKNVFEAHGFKFKDV